MLGIAKFMDSTTLTHLEHPYKIKKKKKERTKKKKQSWRTSGIFTIQICCMDVDG